jgi:hypothetical protein
VNTDAAGWGPDLPPDPADQLCDVLVLADDVALLADEVCGRLASLTPGPRRAYLVQLVAARRALAALVRAWAAARPCPHSPPGGRLPGRIPDRADTRRPAEPVH